MVVVVGGGGVGVVVVFGAHRAQLKKVGDPVSTLQPSLPTHGALLIPSAPVLGCSQAPGIS